MGDLMLRDFFEDDFFGFGLPRNLRFSTGFTKDMMPVYWKKWYEKVEEKDGAEVVNGEQLGYFATVRTVGIDPSDLNIDLKDNYIFVDGETEVEGTKYSQHVELPISKEIVANIEKINFKSKDGLTYIYVKVKTPEKTKIAIERI